MENFFSFLSLLYKPEDHFDFFFIIFILIEFSQWNVEMILLFVTENSFIFSLSLSPHHTHLKQEFSWFGISQQYDY